MQMRAGRAAAVANAGNDLVAFDLLALFDQNFLQMAVTGQEISAMPKHDDFAEGFVRRVFVAHQDDDAIGRRQHIRALTCDDIDAVVHLFFLRERVFPLAKTAGDATIFDRQDRGRMQAQTRIFAEALLRLQQISIQKTDTLLQSIEMFLIAQDIIDNITAGQGLRVGILPAPHACVPGIFIKSRQRGKNAQHIALFLEGIQLRIDAAGSRIELGQRGAQIAVFLLEGTQFCRLLVAFHHELSRSGNDSEEKKQRDGKRNKLYQRQGPGMKYILFGIKIDEAHAVFSGLNIVRKIM